MAFTVDFQRYLVVDQDVDLPPGAELLLFELVAQFLQGLPYLEVAFVFGRPCDVALLEHRPLGFGQRQSLRVNVGDYLAQNVLFQIQFLILLDQLPDEL